MKNAIMNRLSKKTVVALMLLAFISLAQVANAQSSVDAIVTGAETTFSAVATLCVAMGVFFIGYRIAKRVR